MPRTKIDFHASRHDAAAALSSLREIGLNPGDIGGAWLAEPNPLDFVDFTSNTCPAKIVEVPDIGRVHFSGWLAELAQKVDGHPAVAPLEVIFDELTSSPQELERVRGAIASGGGIVSVRASDAFTLAAT